ncbi:MAG TPA: ATP-binding protein [Gammaproteobacteria bacterium]
MTKQTDLRAYTQFLESVPDAMLVVGHDGVIRAANSRVTELLYYTPAELVGRPVECLLPERLRSYHVAHRRTFAANPHARTMGTGMELLALSRDGREIPVEISLSPIETREGSLVAAALRDTTARVTAERALRQAKEAAEQANASKSHFLAAASHDLRQPLQTLRMYLDALPRSIEAGLHQEVTSRMGRAVGSLAEILDALLDIARLDMGQVQPEIATFAVDELLQALVADAQPQAEAKGLELKLVSSRYQVRSDRGLLGRIVGNLLANAVRHTERGKVLVGCRRHGANLRIEVWDSGPGIPAEALERIFDEYVQIGNAERARNQGLGLGLSIVRRLAALLEHPVSVVSTPGRGSVFALEVPHEERVAATSQGAWEPVREPAAGSSRRVLFIEDDPDLREATRLILDLDGYVVHCAENGEHAFRAVLEQGVDPDVILSDFRLPGAHNGAEVVARVRELLGRDVPVVFMTGDTSEARIRETRMAHCSVLRKPVDSLRLSAALTTALAALERPG